MLRSSRLRMIFVLAFSFIATLNSSHTQTNVRGWYANGQVWIVWQNTAPAPETYAIYASPNPFNPSTIIKYQLPEDARVSLTIFDILGRTVATPVERLPLKAGYYESRFDGTNLSSGIYLYRLDAGSFQQIRKMLIVR